jgi:hypothetical protein
MANRSVSRLAAVAAVLGLSGAASAQWSFNGSNIFFNTGNVSIGTNAAPYRLYVVSPSTSIVGTTTAASSVATGVQGQSASTLGRGVYGFATSETGQSYGGLFRSLSNQGIGAYALADSPTGVTFGFRGQSASTAGTGVSGVSTALTGNTAGVRAQAASTSGSGVAAFATAGSGFTNGVYGESSSVDGAGVFGFVSESSGVNYGVYGESASTENGYGVFAVGRSGASGTKEFRIDHPLDPANRFLHHFSAEGPEPYLVYRGNVVLDAQGMAVVQLPAYVEAINRDFTYDLTPIGAPADLYIAQEVVKSQFAIAGGRPHQKVSWTVTGVRNDAFVRAYPQPAEQFKPAGVRGRYLHPELVGLGEEWGLRPRPAGEGPVPLPAEVQVGNRAGAVAR